jgi:outer membrane lipase/esterase
VEVETIAKSCTFVARNPVEMAIAQYLDKIMPMSSGDLWRVLGEFQSLSEKEFKRAFKSFSPDAYDNTTRASYFATKEYTDTLQKRMNTLRSGFIIPGAQPRAESKKEPVRLAYNGGNIGDLLGTREQVEAERRWALWIDGFGQWGDQDPEIGFAGFDYSVYGGAVGLDYMVQDKFIFGAGFGYSFSDIDLGDNQGDGDINSVFGSLYGSYFTERAYVETVLSYGKQNYDNVRNVVIGPIQRRAYSEHDGDLFSAYLGGGYYFPVRDWRWGPFGSLLYTYLDEDGFQETGAGSLNLALGSRSTDGLLSRLGLRVGRVFRTKSVNLIPELSLAWLYDFDIDDRVITSSIAGAPGISFSVPGQPVERHGVVFGAGITLVSGDGFRASLKYGGEFRDTYTAHALLGELRFLF